MKYAILSSALGLALAAGSVVYAAPETPTSDPDDVAAPVSAMPAGIAGLTGENLVENGDFEAGEVGWEVFAPGGQVAVDRTGRGGSAGLVVKATEDTRVRAVYEIAGEVLPAASQVRAAAWVRSSRPRQEIQLAVDEIQRDGGWQPVHETIRTYDRGWETVRTTAVTEENGSTLRFRVDLLRLPAGATIRLDDVWASRTTRPSVPVGPWSRRLDNGCAVSHRGVPVCSAYFGAAYKLNDDPSPWEASMGRPLGVRRTYFGPDDLDSAMETVVTDLAAGRLPWISFKLPYSWADMAAGRGDRWVMAVSRRLAQAPGPVWVAFHHEPEGDGDVTEWTAMQRRMAPMVRSIAPNVAYTVILTGWNQFHGDKEYRLRSIWPQGTKIDVAGFDLYNFHGARQDGQVERRTTPMAQQYFAPLSRWARAHDVAWAVAETGYTHAAARKDPAWLFRTYQQLLHHGGVAFTYFNSAANSPIPWALGTSAKLEQFEYAIRHTPHL